tara:strand:+ start:123 stop:1364 length:1242 start_codon:yes stop_codon:yes gene_type:complete
MAETINLGNGDWAVKDNSLLAYNDENGNYKPLPFDFTRASTATVVNKQGLIESVASGEPRIDYSSDANGALLLEPQSTNLIPYSESFDNSYWNKNAYSVSKNLATSPDGNLTADKIIASVGLNPLAPDGSGLFPTSSLSSSSYSYSVFAKSGERNIIRWRDGGSSGQFLTVDLSNGTFVNGRLQRFIDVKVIYITNGWYRISFTTPAINNLAVYPLRFGDVGEIGDGTSGGYIWGAQLEQNSYATSYVPTSGTTQTRVAETCGGAGSSSSINSEEGVLYAEISALSDDKTNRVISITNGSSSERVSLFYGNESLNEIKGIIVTGGALSANLSFTGNDITVFSKIAVKYKQNDFQLWVNGVKVVFDTSGNTPTGLNKLSFDLGQGSAPLYGNTKDLRVYSTALTDSELQALTTL